MQGFGPEGPADAGAGEHGSKGERGAWRRPGGRGASGSCRIPNQSRNSLSQNERGTAIA
eukprot:gene13131-3922_t